MILKAKSELFLLNTYRNLLICYWDGVVN